VLVRHQFPATPSARSMRTALLFVILLNIAALQPSYALDGAITLKQGELRLSDSATPPLAPDGWKPIKLPDQWDASRYNGRGSGNGWYRFDLAAPPPRTLQGIYLPRLNMNAAVWFNGSLLGDGGSFDEPLGRNWSRPLYFTIPSALWHERGNRIEIRLASYYGYGLLGPVTVGPDAMLKEAYQQQLFWQAGIANSLFLILLAISLFMFSIWHRRRGDTVYFWFACTTLLWSLLALNIFISEIPVSEKAWDTFIYSTVAWWTVFVAIFSHRFAKTRHPKLELTYIAWATVTTLAYINSDLTSLQSVSFYGQIGSPLIGFITLWRLTMTWRQSRERSTAALAIGIALVQLAGIYNFLTQALIIPEFRPIAGHILEISSPILLILIAWHLTGRFVNAMNELEALNAELEMRVAAKHTELEASYQKLSELEKQQATIQERERIHRDLHDDVGAKLLTLTYRAKDDESAYIARSALQDLRDVVSHGASSAFKLTDALADWRAEAADRLDAADITLKWQQPDALPDQLLLPQQTMNIGRILREAISNAIRHASPANVLIVVSADSGNIYIVIEDDGAGGNAALWRSGRGTQNMNMRAKLLGGEISWVQREPAGTRIEWWWPLQSPETTT